MSQEEMLRDGMQAAILIKDVVSFMRPLVSKLTTSGAEVQYPELRLKCPEQTMEYTAGPRLRKKLLSGNYAKLNIPIPEKCRLVSLAPYRPLDEAVTITREGIAIDRRLLQGLGENFRIELVYPLESSKALNSLVYRSSPSENLEDDDEAEIQRFWLHSELKSVEFLRDIYKHVRIEDVDVVVDVTLREDVKAVISPDLRFEMGMMAKLGSRDRNEQRRALEYRRRHPVSKFRGNIFKAMQDAQELFQPSKFRRFLSLEGSYRLSKCRRGASLSDVFLPLYFPQSMLVYSATDLTLENPAMDGKLIYKKSEFMKRLEKILRG
jgi:hypothetical protein